MSVITPALSTLGVVATRYPEGSGVANPSLLTLGGSPRESHRNRHREHRAVLPYGFNRGAVMPVITPAAFCTPPGFSGESRGSRATPGRVGVGRAAGTA